MILSGVSKISPNLLFGISRSLLISYQAFHRCNIPTYVTPLPHPALLHNPLDSGATVVIIIIVFIVTVGLIIISAIVVIIIITNTLAKQIPEAFQINHIYMTQGLSFIGILNR